MDINIKNKIKRFNIVSMAITYLLSSFSIILTFAFYGLAEYQITLFQAFILNFLVLSIPSFLMFFIGLIIFKKNYKFKYIFMFLTTPLIIAICEHIMFVSWLGL